MDNPVFTDDTELKKDDVRKRTNRLPNGDTDGDIKPETVKLKKHVGLVGGTSFIVGTIIGSGIFISPKGVLSETGSVGLSLIVWVGAGLLALMGSLCYAELGTLIRKSGGEYQYIKQCFGNIPAFMYAWTSVIVIRPSSMAIICLTFGEYVATFFPYCGNPDLPMKLVAALAIMTLAIINCADTRLATHVQVFFTVAKLVALLIISIGGIVRMAQGDIKELQRGFEGTTNSPSTIALAFYDALWAYDGWNNLNYLTEEIENPKKNLPRANIAGVLLVTVVYLLTNISYLTAMTSAELLASDAVAVTWGDRVLGSAAILMPLSVLFSTFGSANGTLFSGGRVVYVAARDGMLPEMLSYVNCKRYTPVPSIIFTSIISIAMIIPGNLSDLIDFFSFTAWIFYGVTVSSLIVCRFTMKDAERVFKVPLPIPILFVLLSLYLIIGPIIQSPRIEFLYAFLFIIGGLIFYVPLVYFKLNIPFWGKISTFSQLFFESVPSPYIPDE
ncbi:b(0,+)-type amino acid transporter 1-like [Mizuhopecten yessoensis]|uniref:b(0,+)-type amino acid transporter 1 n=1 Tax=Mizuhopecten yessoensis TaxID=6573 RepID=A0A210QMD3_MIZYE|nr:b(0,+)-type amino acid transporter 1-like [Mizuhopecten yessoensis]OWF49892.1 B(0,+)-type amino acid transporter 1 [Mizuhopecten yessoensis]